jgi:NitT/TauT family transport system ATP-binding protein
MTNPPPASDGMVAYDNVSKFFPVRIRPGQKDRPELMVALDRINATVRKGELITLLGPSGCGKTTLLRLTAGLLAADEGADVRAHPDFGKYRAELREMLRSTP